MFNLFRSILKKGKDQELKPIEFDFDGEIRFILRIKDLKIGQLSIEKGLWTFVYCQEFRRQDKYTRLTGFSDLNKKYQAEVLWPFFKIRIPGLKQPMIREIIEAEDLDESNEAVLLKRFGKLSMSNPYILESA